VRKNGHVGKPKSVARSIPILTGIFADGFSGIFADGFSGIFAVRAKLLACADD
jgi:hypothetical protein